MAVAEATQVFRLEVWGDERVPVIVCWDHTAPCGCVVSESIRPDKDEPCVGTWTCSNPVHQEDLGAFVRNLTDYMPEPERPLHEVVVERFAAVVGGW